MPVSCSTAWAYASAWVTVHTPQARSTSGSAAAERATLDELLEAAMDEEESRVEVEDPLADRREAEVAGLDDPGVDRADRELVDALAVDLERHEAPLGVGRPDVGRDVLAERVVAARPALVEDEPTRVGVADRDDPEQVARLALVPVRGRDERA